MSKTAKIEARVLPARLERYKQAAEVLHLEEMSDFVRRACDRYADHVLAEPVLGSKIGAPGQIAGDLARKQVTPRPRRA